MTQRVLVPVMTELSGINIKKTCAARLFCTPYGANENENSGR